LNTQSITMLFTHSHLMLRQRQWENRWRTTDEFKVMSISLSSLNTAA
jgi:hypothetical protein